MHRLRFLALFLFLFAVFPERGFGSPHVTEPTPGDLTIFETLVYDACKARVCEALLLPNKITPMSRASGDLGVWVQPFSLDYMYGMFAVGGYWQFAQAHQLEAGIGGSILYNHGGVAYKYLFLPRSIVSPLVSLGLSRWVCCDGFSTEYLVGSLGLNVMLAPALSNFEIGPLNIRPGGFAELNLLPSGCQLSRSNYLDDCGLGLWQARMGVKF